MRWLVFWILLPGNVPELRLPERVALLPSTEKALLTDVQSLGPFFENATIVGLGEANHGTAEFFRYKNRIIQYLVKHQGFRNVLFESGYFSCHQLNAYVKGEDISLGAALLDQQYTIWVTQEVAELFVWLRAFNQNAAQKVRISGFDARDNGRGRDLLKSYLSRVDPPFLDANEALLDEVSLTGFTSREQANIHAEELAIIKATMVQKSKVWKQKAGRAAFDEAYQALAILLQANAYARAPSSASASNGRDFFMAENIKTLAAQSPGEKWIIWAHNGHVGVGTNGVPGGTNLGAHLDRWLGDKYVNIGFSFRHGDFRAYGKKDGASAYFPFSAGEAFPGSVGAYFANAGEKPFFVDLGKVKQGPLDDSMVTRWADGAVQPGYLALWQNQPQKIRFTEQFDGLIFVPRIRAAKTYQATRTP